MKITIRWENSSRHQGSVEVMSEEKRRALKARLNKFRLSLDPLDITPISIFARIDDHVIREEIEKGEWD